MHKFKFLEPFLLDRQRRRVGRRSCMSRREAIATALVGMRSNFELPPAQTPGDPPPPAQTPGDEDDES